VIVLTGAPGAGKTTTGRCLIELCPPHSAWIDADRMAAVHPWHIDAAFYDLVGANLSASLNNFHAWGARVVVVAGVILPGGTRDRLQPLFDRAEFEWQWYSLVASPEVLAARIREDAKEQDAKQRLKWLYLDEEARCLPDAVVIDTTSMPTELVAATIARREGWSDDRAVDRSAGGGQRETHVSISLTLLTETASRALEGCGVDRAVATLATDALVRAEIEGHPSHGILRIAEYADAIRRGALDPAGRPVAERVGPQVRVIDGRRGLGVLAAQRIVTELVEILTQAPIALVGLRNSGHIGRLAHVVEAVAKHGYVALGFVNFQGAGQKMQPWGGAEGRLATNPLSFAVPSALRQPMVIDMTSAAVSEGTVRVKGQDGEALPAGWLVDRNGQTVRDPKRLYDVPPTAFLAPLGGPLGHKGYSLALMVEVLAGILTGGGFSSPSPGPGGNAGLFIGLRLDALNRPSKQVLDEIEALLAWCSDQCPTQPGVDVVRLPYQRSREVADKVARAGTVSINRTMWDSIRAMADGIR
jgi:LDH2 family malate/lactate/ureidoglycolate dehydrogenase